MAKEKTLRLAYAVPIEPSMLAASVAAYAKTRASTATFSHCIKHSSSASPIGRLPAEIICLVQHFVYILTRDKELLIWEQRLECLLDKCVPLDPHGQMTGYRSERLRPPNAQRYIARENRYDHDDLSCTRYTKIDVDDT